MMPTAVEDAVNIANLASHTRLKDQQGCQWAHVSGHTSCHDGVFTQLHALAMQRAVLCI